MARNEDGLQMAVADHLAGRIAAAEAGFAGVLAAEPGHPVALHHLGLIAAGKGDFAQAAERLSQAVADATATPDALADYGSVLLRLGDVAAAHDALVRAAALAPDNAEVHYNRGLALRGLDRLPEAEVAYRLAVALAPDHAAAHNNLGNILSATGRAADAIACFRAALDADSGYVPAERNLADALEADGDVAGAAAAFDTVVQLRGDDGARIRRACILPAIAESADQLAEARAEFEDALTRLAGEKLSIGDPLHEVGATPFMTAYDDRSNRAVHETLADIHRRACPDLNLTARHCDDWSMPNDRRIRIGFASAFFRNHTVGRLNLGLIAGLPRDRFHVTLFALSAGADEMTARLAQAADEFVTVPRDLAHAGERIAAAELDILYYPDIGMEPFSYFLAFARLAPIQCVSWGHPDTTGIQTIDCFVTCGPAEPENAAADYTETLAPLPGLINAVQRPETPGGAGRGEFGVAPETKLFVCPQSLFKFHPDFDPMLRRILKDDDRAELLVLHGNRRGWSERLRARLGRTMGDVIDQIRFLPRLDHGHFLRLLAAAAVVLDTPHFCGGYTTTETLGVGTPVVTLPGRFLRGRVSLALLEAAGVPDLIAENADDYVETALTLANDRVYAGDIRAKIAAGAKNLFDSADAIDGHVEFFVRALATRAG